MNGDDESTKVGLTHRNGTERTAPFFLFIRNEEPPA